jgi:hypothetical protein
MVGGDLLFLSDLFGVLGEGDLLFFGEGDRERERDLAYLSILF